MTVMRPAPAYEQARAWAAEVGIPADPDVAPWCARRFPAAPARELGVVTCWHLWLSFVDSRPRKRCSEAALADLWSRTVAGRSAAWRDRFADTVSRVRAESSWWRVIRQRRRSHSPQWSATLVEYTTGAEVPADLVQALGRRFADCAYLADEGAGPILHERLREFETFVRVRLPALTGDDRILRYATGMRDWLLADHTLIGGFSS